MERDWNGANILIRELGRVCPAIGGFRVELAGYALDVPQAAVTAWFDARERIPVPEGTVRLWVSDDLDGQPPAAEPMAAPVEISWRDGQWETRNKSIPFVLRQARHNRVHPIAGRREPVGGLAHRVPSPCPSFLQRIQGRLGGSPSSVHFSGCLGMCESLPFRYRNCTKPFADVISSHRCCASVAALDEPAVRVEVPARWCPYLVQSQETP